MSLDAKKPIKSYVIREGRITNAQKQAISILSPKYAISFQKEEIDLNSTFGNNHEVIIEIGFGMGQATLEIALNNPQNNYIGIETHKPGVGALLMQIDKHQVNNLKLINHDSVEVLKYMIKGTSIHGFHIFFPDPWPKKRHHKRRIVNSEFIKLLSQKLVSGGYIHLATDWEDYASSMLEVLNNESTLKNTSQDNTFIPRPLTRPHTKFEERGEKLGHNIWDLKFVKF